MVVDIVSNMKYAYVNISFILNILKICKENILSCTKELVFLGMTNLKTHSKIKCFRSMSKQCVQTSFFSKAYSLTCGIVECYGLFGPSAKLTLHVRQGGW